MDPSNYKITISHEDVEEIMREELKEIIKDHKLNMLQIEHSFDGLLGLDEHEDYLQSKKLIHAAAVVLHYHSLPADWPEIQKIQDEHEV